jgi:hypothetical protein
VIENKSNRYNQLSWEERHPSDYSFKKIDVSQFLTPKKIQVSACSVSNNNKQNYK